MERPNRIPQLYGYTVCVIAVVTFLICSATIVNSLFNLANPVQSGYGFESSVSSFEAYKATYDRDRQPPGGGATAARPDTLSEASLRTRYEAVRADRIQRVRFRAARSITTSGLLLVIAVVLFVVHWRWLRRQASVVEPQ